MATYSNYALRVPASLMEDLRTAADSDGVSMNGCIVQAVAEKIAALWVHGPLPTLSEAEQSAYLQSRAAQARPSQMAAILAKAGTTGAVRPGDELPEDWLGETSDRGTVAPGA
ncbi:MAG TPA: Arc family DNA-binding protein [Acetobacteraceae bacterium]|nr:Arc family DNA-binding protein [Acetobacteraceae bacterium]